MMYVKAHELKVGDRVRHDGAWYKVIDVVIGATKVAVTVPRRDTTVFIEFAASVEVLIENRIEPVPMPEMRPEWRLVEVKPESVPEWYISFCWDNKGLCAAQLQRNGSLWHAGPWVKTKEEATSRMLAELGSQRSVAVRMTHKLLVLLSCGHHIEQQGTRRGSVEFFLDRKHTQVNMGCFRDGGGNVHESFVSKVLTSNVDRLWIEEL